MALQNGKGRGQVHPALSRNPGGGCAKVRKSAGVRRCFRKEWVFFFFDAGGEGDV